MQNTSPLYRRIMSATEHWFETRLVIGASGNLITERGERILFGPDSIVVARVSPDAGFSEEFIFSIQTSTQMFERGPEIGKAIAGEIDVKMIKPAGDMERMGVIVPYIRAKAIDDETGKELVSEWLQQGVYFIDTREISNNDTDLVTLTLHGFDAMLKAEQNHTTTGTMTDTRLVSAIAEKMGVSVDPRTWEIMTEGYEFTVTPSYTMREMLGYIAGAYGGNFLMTDLGELRLVTLWELPRETRYLVDDAGYVIVFGTDSQTEEPIRIVV